MAMNLNFGDRFFASRASLQMHASKRNGKTYKWSKLYLDTFFLLSLSWLLSCFFFFSSSRFFIFSLFLLFISMDDCSLESKIKKNKTKKIGRILMTHGRSDKWHDRFSFRLLPISLLCVICWLLFFLLTQYLSRRCLLWKFSFWLTTTWHQQLKLDYHNSQQFFLR